MGDRNWHADMIVGIDFGMTCTAVAFSMGPEWPDPKTIQRWPGKLLHELSNKVDTAISYDLQTHAIHSWGFMSDPYDEKFEFNNLFKLHLDPQFRDPSEHAPSTAEAQAWFQDYLNCLHSHLRSHFSITVPRFDTKNVDFVFSVPVTWWRNPQVLTQIERLIHQAGFGGSERERATILLTEAEAAGIYASKQSMVKDDVFMVCDAGGGTTDITILKVESANKNRVQLLPLSWSEGNAVGSTVIDFKISKLIEERLMTVSDYIQSDIDSVISVMIRDKFIGYKCSFGDSIMNVPCVYLPIPGMKPGMNFPQIGIENSKMALMKHEIQTVFDEQVDKICTKITEQIAIMRERHAGEKISHIILSGGLGSSTYVQNQIRARFGVGNFAGLQGLRVIMADEPQLAVVHGLVLARVQANRGGPDILSLRCCPVSFGILSREEYDPKKHQYEEVELDEFDNKRWAKEQINWIIKQGQLIPSGYQVRHPYRLKLEMGKENERWGLQIVKSHLPEKQLPRSMRWDGAEHLCSVEVELDARDMRRLNTRWYNKRKEYNLAEFEIRIIVGVGLKFEVWTHNGMRSKDHTQIEVMWEHA